MTLTSLWEKFGSFLILILGLIFYVVSESSVESYQASIVTLKTEQQNLRQKIHQATQQKQLRERVMTEFQQARTSGRLSFDNHENLMLILEQLSHHSGLKKSDYQIQEVKKQHLKNITLHWHKILFDLEHYQDRDIFNFIQTLSHKIPGLILPEQLSLVRADPLSLPPESDTAVSGFYHFYVVTFDVSAMSTP